MARQCGDESIISIITSVLNGAAHLEDCLESVARQVGVRVEHIVIDGGSTDGSVEVLHRWSHRLAFWSSGPDRGIGDAMNKGLAHARGRWLLFLHADDELLGDRSLVEVAARLDKTNAKIIGFPIHYGSATARRLIRPRGGTPWLRFKTGFLHQATFFDKSVFDEIGVYDTSLRIAMDYELFLRAWCRGVSFATCPAPTPAWMRDTGISARRDWPSLQRRLGEERLIHGMHAGTALWRAIYVLYWAAYMPYRRLLALLTPGS